MAAVPSNDSAMSLEATLPERQASHYSVCSGNRYTPSSLNSEEIATSRSTSGTHLVDGRTASRSAARGHGHPYGSAPTGRTREPSSVPIINYAWPQQGIPIFPAFYNVQAATGASARSYQEAYLGRLRTNYDDYMTNHHNLMGQFGRFLQEFHSVSISSNLVVN